MKVYSATQFCGELDILDVRLNTLDPVVDYHIITESNIYWNGSPKPFYFEENAERFKKFRNKIIYQKHFTDNGLPSDYVNLKPEDGRTPEEQFIIKRVLSGDWWGHEYPAYGRDTYEKESVYLPMASMCQPDDMIILSDLDEIPNPGAVKSILDSFDHNEVYNFNLRTFYYYMNTEKEAPEPATIMLSFENFKKIPFCELKMKRRGMIVQNSGWHFSYQGGADAIKHKIETFSEWYLNTDNIKNNIQINMDTALTSGHDLYFRPTKFKLAPIETLPQYVIDHQNDIYKDYLKR
jgi:beta-1,4-mannosyl-glycoprotein beta-1,4-N-acetylglucosaminyltransferase